MVSGVRQEDSCIAIRYLHETEKQTVKKLCGILGVNRSSYYKWLKRKPSTKQLKNSVCRIKKKTYIPSTPETEADNVLNRELYADAPNEKWLTDVTEFKYYHFYNTGRFQKRLHCMTPMEFHYAYVA